MHLSLITQQESGNSQLSQGGSRVKVDETRNSSRARVQLNDGVCWWIPVLLDSFEWFHAGSTVRREEWMPPWMHPKVEIRTCIRDSAFASCMDAVQVRFSSHFLPLFGVLSGHWVVRFWNPVQRQKYSFQHVSFSSVVLLTCQPVKSSDSTGTAVKAAVAVGEKRHTRQTVGGCVAGKRGKLAFRLPAWYFRHPVGGSKLTTGGGDHGAMFLLFPPKIRTDAMLCHRVSLSSFSLTRGSSLPFFACHR